MKRPVGVAMPMTLQRLFNPVMRLAAMIAGAAFPCDQPPPRG
ncbi:hypothetical protein [Komagataeibacter saccharivorans]|nr:hypothetical protein [Komagataeibacter saccharivorans]